MIATPVARAQAPAETTAIEAFIAVRGWLDRDSLPPLEAAESRLELPGTTAVAILLRADGRVVGRGEDATGDALMVRRAAGRAVADALGDETIRAVRADLGDRVTARLSLEVELAGPTRPLLGRTIAEAAARIVPGAEGIALLKGDEVLRAFPSRFLAIDAADRPDATITGLMRSAGLPTKELPEFGPGDRVSLGRFDTTRLRQASAEAAPSVLARGGRLVELSEVTPGILRALAAQLAARLAGQVVPLPTPEDAGSSTAHDGRRWALLGTYNPTADSYDPPFAGPSDEAFAAIALARASGCDSLPEPTRVRAAESAGRLIAALLAHDPGERNDAVDAMTLLACRLIPADRLSLEGETRAASSALLERVRSAARASRSLLSAALAGDQPIAVDGRAIETASISVAALTAEGSSPEDRALAGALVDAILTRTSESRARLADGLLPLSMAVATGALPETSQDSLRGILGEVAVLLDTFQLMPPADVPSKAALESGPADFPPDLYGGFSFPGARSVLADSQGLRAAAGLALLRRPPNATPEAQNRLEVRDRAALRFLLQHVADEPWTDGFRRPEALRGLVRASLATDDCPPAATAAGVLLAISALPAAPK